jgi:membrane-associated phospholipid phosphatase
MSQKRLTSFAALVLLSFLTQKTWAQTDSARFRLPAAKSLVVPLALMGGGLATLNEANKTWQRNWHQQHFATFDSRLDDYINHGPAVICFGLDLAGVQGKHRMGDKLILFVLSQGVVQTVTQVLKQTTQIQRPDGNGLDAFPSGHTSWAFANAAFLEEEYGHVSVAWTIAGYGMATATGALRMFNNRHWLSDVLFGAGVGIGGTKLVYALYPWIQRRILKRDNLAVVPFYNGQGGGVAFAMTF